MTFSENDLLPYKNIKYELTAEYFKTILMQLTVLKPSFHETGGHVTHVGLNALSQAAVLDMNDSIVHDYYRSRDFAANFEQLANGTDPETRASAARHQELMVLIYRLSPPEMAGTKARVEQILIDELKEANIPESNWAGQSWTMQAIILANYRIQKKLGEREPGRTPLNHRKRITVQLQRLIGGFFECTRTTTLIFEHDASFREFDRVLQEHTKLCVISPEGVESTRSTPSEGSFSSDLASIPSTTPRETYAAHGTTWVKVTLPVTRAEKGYTAKDGPWQCRIMSTKGVEEGEEHMVHDKNTYGRMIAQLRACMEKSPRYVYSITVMHSRDRKIYDTSRATQMASRLLWIIQCNKDRLEGVGDPEEDLSGDTYMQWLSRQ